MCLCHVLYSRPARSIADSCPRSPATGSGVMCRLHPRRPRGLPMPNIPGGTVTLLFTDIEGSTRLLRRLGERYAEVLAEHHRLLRAAFGAHGGHEVDTQGDSFFVSFPRAVDAVRAVVEAQRALVAHTWPE